MLNLVQHLINSMAYETMEQVQGDKTSITTQSLAGEEEGRVGIPGPSTSLRARGSLSRRPPVPSRVEEGGNFPDQADKGRSSLWESR
jgi:hypothetical protein